MAAEVVWLVAALDDLDSIAAYIAADSETYAANVVRRIQAASRDLPLFPQMGRVVPEYGRNDIRERIVYNYRLIYQVTEARIIILAIKHGAMLLPDDLPQQT